MSGIKFLIDAKGERTAVQIDLKKHGALWEDFHDTLVAKKRENEPRESLETVRKKLIRAGKLHG